MCDLFKTFSASIVPWLFVLLCSELPFQLLKWFGHVFNIIISNNNISIISIKQYRNYYLNYTYINNNILNIINNYTFINPT